MSASACRAFALALLLSVASVLPGPASAGGAATRVITLGGDITEIVYQLGEEGRLVGRDTTSKFPAEAAALPDVGYFRQLGAEGTITEAREPRNKKGGDKPRPGKPLSYLLSPHRLAMILVQEQVDHDLDLILRGAIIDIA